jgi:hypothetical protein
MLQPIPISVSITPYSAPSTRYSWEEYLKKEGMAEENVFKFRSGDHKLNYKRLDSETDIIMNLKEIRWKAVSWLKMEPKFRSRRLQVT